MVVQVVVVYIMGVRVVGDQVVGVWVVTVQVAGAQVLEVVVHVEVPNEVKVPEMIEGLTLNTFAGISSFSVLLCSRS